MYSLERIIFEVNQNIIYFYRDLRKKGILGLINIFISELLFDLKYGVRTKKLDFLEFQDITSRNKSEGVYYAPANINILKKIFNKFSSKMNKDIIIDFGCGKGRPLMIASMYNFRNLIGIEFSAELCEICKRNLLKFRQKIKSDFIFKILNIDAVEYEIPDNASVFFFYDPFSFKILKDVAKNINISLERNPRGIHIIYVHPRSLKSTGIFEKFDIVHEERDFIIFNNTV